MSQINPSSIDELFPVQGQDNPSQGFRNNFLYIKQGLATAQVEITELENISAKLNSDNNFNGHRLENVIVNKVSELFKNNGNVGGVGVEAVVTDSQIQNFNSVDAGSVLTIKDIRYSKSTLSMIFKQKWIIISTDQDINLTCLGQVKNLKVRRLEKIFKNNIKFID